MDKNHKEYVLIFLIAFLVSGIFIFSANDTKIKNSTDERFTNNLEKIHDIGEKFTVEDISYTVNKVRKTKYIKNRFNTVKAHNIYIIVFLNISNIGDNPLDISNHRLDLIDTNQKRYKIDEKATYTIDNGINPGKLDPKTSKTGKILYDVPKNTTYNLKIQPKDTSSKDIHFVYLGSP